MIITYLQRAKSVVAMVQLHSISMARLPRPSPVHEIQQDAGYCGGNRFPAGQNGVLGEADA